MLSGAGGGVRHVRADQVAGTRAPAPNSRTLKHLVAPWTLGSRHVWVGLSEIDVGSSSNLHVHESEEVFFVVSGRGAVEVEGERQEIASESAVLVPSGSRHRLVNEGNERLRVLCCASPAFERDVFDAAHDLGGSEG